MLFQGAEIDTGPQNTRRRAGFQSLQFDARLQKRPGQTLNRKIPHAPAFVLILTHMHQPPQKSPGSHNHGFGVKFDLQISPNAHSSPILINKALNHRLENIQIILQLQNMFHPKLISFFIALRTGRLHRRSFGGI